MSLGRTARPLGEDPCRLRDLRHRHVAKGHNLVPKAALKGVRYRSVAPRILDRLLELLRNDLHPSVERRVHTVLEVTACPQVVRGHAVARRESRHDALHAVGERKGDTAADGRSCHQPIIGPGPDACRCAARMRRSIREGGASASRHRGASPRRRRPRAGRDHRAPRLRRGGASTGPRCPARS